MSDHEKRVIDRPDIRELSPIGEVERLATELAALKAAICEFADKHSWADETWKRQPHIKKLFDIAAKERA